MRRIAICGLALSLGTGGVSAATTGGNGGLALAALVGMHSPHVTAHDRHLLSLMLDSHLNFAFPANGTIVVAADSVSCRISDVDISYHDCTLKFGATTRTLSGRAAEELYAVLVENGVLGDGAAGSIYEAVTHLNCTIKPGEVKQRDGGGASCTMDPGP